MEKLFVGLLVLAFCVTLASWYLRGEELKSANDTLEWYRVNYLRKQGWSQKWGSFNYISLDAGKNWWIADTANKEIKIVGPAPAEHLTEMAGWDKLIDYAKVNGPITLGGPNLSEQIQVLKGAGFEVKEK